MKVIKAETLTSMPGPKDWFTGTVRVEMLFSTEAPGRTSGAQVTFEPGACTAWHTHPAGQTIIITYGRGHVQREGGKIKDVCVGDIVCFPAGEKHWHGAAKDAAMSHIAIQESINGSPVMWLEKVNRDN